MYKKTIVFKIFPEYKNLAETLVVGDWIQLLPYSIYNTFLCRRVALDASLVLLEAVSSDASGSYGDVAIKLAGLRGCHL